MSDILKRKILNNIASWVSRNTNVPVLVEPEDSFQKEMVFLESCWVVDDKVCISTENSNPIVISIDSIEGYDEYIHIETNNDIMEVSTETGRVLFVRKHS